ncbi:reverse transcriptase [Senna tora]|uniref:Reverse transcriptase n=1 Tax=Senna tora TaxID=362788 RepID=A0A834W798_9FABA|nr:reverse transcriptase [Senna tora]
MRSEFTIIGQRMLVVLVVLIIDWVQENLTKEWGKVDDLQWNTVFGMACWLIWKQRNSCVFTDVQNTAISLLPQVKAYSDLVSNSETPFKPSISNDSNEIKWCLPEKDWIKVNSDGSCANDGMSCCGGVLRDNKGKWISGYSKKLGKGDVLHAEAWGCCGSHPLSPLINKINSVKDHFNNFKVAHVYREANRLADTLAARGYSLPYGTNIFERTPAFCSLIFFDDSRGVLFSRGSCS